MAVRADDLALRDFVEPLTPVFVRQALGDLERLVLDVIELEDDGIRFAAVDAWVRHEELEKGKRPLKTSQFFAYARLLDVALFVGEIVLAVIRLCDKGDTCCAVAPSPCGARRSP